MVLFKRNLKNIIAQGTRLRSIAAAWIGCPEIPSPPCLIASTEKSSLRLLGSPPRRFAKHSALQDKTSQSESRTNTRKPNLPKTTAGHEGCLPRETEPNRPLEVPCKRVYTRSKFKAYVKKLKEKYFSVCFSEKIFKKLFFTTSRKN